MQTYMDFLINYHKNQEMPENNENPGGQPEEEGSWTFLKEMESSLKSWKFVIAAVLAFILIVLTINGIWGKSESQLCSNETVIIGFEKMLACRLRKPKSGLKVTNEIAIKGCFLQSLITIRADESCWMTTSNQDSGRHDQGYNGKRSDGPITNVNIDNPCSCNCGGQEHVQSSKTSSTNPRSVPSISPISSTSKLASADASFNANEYGNQAAIINSIHLKLLQRRILSGKWNEKICKEDHDGPGNILLSASFISVKFLVFSNDTASPEIKASYFARNTSFELHGLHEDDNTSPMTFSKFWRFKKSPTCFASQRSEIIIVPMKLSCDSMLGGFKKLFKIDNDSLLGRCSHSTKEVIASENVKQQVPNLITSVLICH